MGQSQLFGRRLGVRPCDSEITVGMAGVGRRHPHASDAFDIGDRCVADPVGTDAKFPGPCQVLDASSEPFEPLVVEMPTVLSMEHKAAAVVSKGSVGHQAGDEVGRDRDPPLLGVLLNETNRSGRGCQIVVAQSDGSLPSSARLSEEPEDEVVEFGIT